MGIAVSVAVVAFTAAIIALIDCWKCWKDKTKGDNDGNKRL